MSLLVTLLVALCVATNNLAGAQEKKRMPCMVDKDCVEGLVCKQEWNNVAEKNDGFCQEPGTVSTQSTGSTKDTSTKDTSTGTKDTKDDKLSTTDDTPKDDATSTATKDTKDDKLSTTDDTPAMKKDNTEQGEGTEKEPSSQAETTSSPKCDIVQLITKLTEIEGLTEKEMPDALRGLYAGGNFRSCAQVAQVTLNTTFTCPPACTTAIGPTGRLSFTVGRPCSLSCPACHC
jgi:hypothetical protein